MFLCLCGERGATDSHAVGGHFFPEGIRRIHPQHRQLAGEELQFLQCETHVALLGMTFDVGIELRRVERTAKLIALQA